MSDATLPDGRLREQLKGLKRYFQDWRNPDGWIKPAELEALLVSPLPAEPREPDVVPLDTEVPDSLVPVPASPLHVPLELQEADTERWRKFYRALAWMVNDYIGVTEHIDYTKKHERLGYAHEGYHNARAVMRESKPPVPDGMQQGIRCKCWAKERGG